MSLSPAGRRRAGTLLLVNEGVAQRKHEADDTFWRGLVREVSPPAAARGALEVVRECLVDYKLTEGDTHGFEGSHYVDAGSEGELLFLLCEGNHCEGKKGRGKETGNGRIVVARFDAGNSSAPCAWRTQKVLEIPSTADFLDFADLDIEHAARGQSRIAVVSQEDAALWLGRIDLEKLEFMGDGEVLHFPRGADCLELYCNVEGVAFLDACAAAAAADASAPPSTPIPASRSHHLASAVAGHLIVACACGAPSTQLCADPDTTRRSQLARSRPWPSEAWCKAHMCVRSPHREPIIDVSVPARCDVMGTRPQGPFDDGDGPRKERPAVALRRSRPERPDLRTPVRVRPPPSHFYCLAAAAVNITPLCSADRSYNDSCRGTHSPRQRSVAHAPNLFARLVRTSARVRPCIG